MAAAVDSAADLEEVDMEAVTEAATAMVAVEEEAMVAAVVVVVSVAEIATAAAEAEASVVDEVAAAEAVVVAVTTVIKMVTSPVNAPNKGKSATRSSPPGGTTPINERGWYPYLSHSQNVMTVAELMYDQRGLLSLSSTLLLRNHSLSTTTPPLCIQRTHFTNVFL